MLVSHSTKTNESARRRLHWWARNRRTGTATRGVGRRRDEVSGPRQHHHIAREWSTRAPSEFGTCRVTGYCSARRGIGSTRDCEHWTTHQDTQSEQGRCAAARECDPTSVSKPSDIARPGAPKLVNDRMSWNTRVHCGE